MADKRRGYKDGRPGRKADDEAEIPKNEVATLICVVIP
jgi:hypothetical protein